MDTFRYIAFGLMSILQLLITFFFQIKYIRSFWKKKAKYPIKQLSPLMTLIQTIFFMLLQYSLIILILITDKKDYANCENGIKAEGTDFKQSQAKTASQTTIAFIYLFSRGCCFAFAIAKTYRIGEAYKTKQLKSSDFQTKFLRNEILLLVVGMIYAFVGFPMTTFLTTNLRFELGLQCSLNIYEKNYFYVMINSLIEELLALGLMYILQARHMSDKLYQLTYNVLAIYMVWFAITSLLAQISWSIMWIIIVISFWIRAHVMFYYYVVRPVQLKLDNPMIYIKTSDIEQFEIISSFKWQNIYKDTKIIQSFEGFLQYIDKKKSGFFIEDCSEKFKNVSQKLLFHNFLEISKYIQFERNDQILDRLYQLFPNHHHVFTGFSDPQAFYKNLMEHLKQVYQKYCATKAYKNLQNFYKQNEIFLQNLIILNISVEQFNPDII